jgi:hypothetical protein
MALACEISGGRVRAPLHHGALCAQRGEHTRRAFDTADPAEIARIEDILRSEPGLEQVDPDTLHAALTRIAPGTTLSLADQEPQSPDPSQTK